jgi:hypothetical protein
MTTDADRVRFAVEFVSHSALQMNARDLDKLRRGLPEFLGLTQRGIEPPGGFGVDVSVVRAPYPKDIGKVALFDLQRDAYAMISAAVDGKGFAPTTISDSQELSVDVVGGSDGPRTGRIGGSLRAGFLLTLWFLLISEAGAPVMRCPECKSIFVRVRRQKYCKAQCTDRATWRNYPAEKKRNRPSRVAAYKENGWTVGARSERKAR